MNRAVLATYLLALETALALALARLSLALPFRWLMAGEAPFDDGEAASPPSLNSRPVDPRASAVALTLRRVSRRLPWHSSCLVEALAARRMLRRRNVASVLHFGMRREEGKLKAHAWLEAGGGYVCGGPAAADFKRLASFVRKPR